MSETEGGPRDLYVRMALVEQALLHTEDRQRMHGQMISARVDSVERQVSTVADQTAYLWWHGQETADKGRETQRRVTVAEVAIEAAGTRLDRHDQLADRLRYAAAMLLLAMVAADRMAPETIAKFAKVVPLLPI